MSDLPAGFWQWLLEQDPEEVPFRADVDDPQIAAMYERAAAKVGRE